MNPSVIVPTPEALALAVVIWLITEVIKKSPLLNSVDSEIIALALGIIGGVVGVLTGYFVGQPMAIGIQVVYAVLGAEIVHENIINPLSGGRL